MTIFAVFENEQHRGYSSKRFIGFAYTEEMVKKMCDRKMPKDSNRIHGFDIVQYRPEDPDQESGPFGYSKNYRW